MLQSLLAEGRPLLADGATGTNLRLMLHKLEARTRELNPLAAQNARGIADSAGRPVVVAGSNRADGRPPSLGLAS
jgi:methionine synthase I (cobalamin-dependent)